MFPRSLPWFKFLQTVSVELLSVPQGPKARENTPRTLQTLEHGEHTITSLARSEQKHLAKIITPGIVHSVLNHVVSRTLQIVIRSEELAKVQIASLSVDWMAAQFSSMLPESFVGQNLQRASSLIGTKHYDQERTLLHMLIYLASNHIVLDDTFYLQCNLQTAEALVLLFRLVDLESPRILHNVIQFSRGSATLAAVVEELFQAAMLVGALDLVANILEKNPSFIDMRIQTASEEFRKLPTLHWAAWKGSADLVNLLVKFGADVNQYSGEWTPLAIAARLDTHEVSFEIASILLQNAAKPNPGRGYRPLPLCLCYGNIPLALELLALGAADGPFDSFTGTGHYRIYGGIYSSDEVCVTLMHRLSFLSRVSLYGFAACADHPQSGTRGATLPDEVEDSADESVVLRLIEALQTQTEVLCESDVMILAASRGHLKVMTYLRTKCEQAVDAVNGALSPLYAAVMWNQVHAARQLLEWGASASMDERLRACWNRREGVLPTPLHLAIQFGPTDMVKLLIDHINDINKPIKFLDKYPTNTWDPSDWCPKNDNGFRRIWYPPLSRVENGYPVCPLFFAVLLKRWDKAGILLDSGATPSGDVLVEAAEQGQLEVVARSLEKGIHPDESSSWGLAALEAAATQQHAKVVSHLFQAGATVFDTSFAALFCLGDASTIRALLQTFTETPKLRDKRTNRSYLENAILGGVKEVVDLALEIDQDYYDSGALCAATIQDILHHSSETQLLLHELFKRRESPACIKSQIQLPLESTAISIAAFHDRIDIIEIILQSSIPEFCQAMGVRLRYSETEYMYEDSYFQRDIIWNSWHDSEKPGASPLEYAALGGCRRASLKLLQEGFRPDAGGVHAAMSCLKDDLVELFIERCVNINMVHPYYDHYTPLQAAVRKRDRTLVKRLLAKGADTNMYEPHKMDFPTTWGLPALTIAVQAGDLDLVSLLLENGADINKGQSSGAEFTALQLAVGKGYINIVKCLIDHNANINAERQPASKYVTLGHGTPLEEAARWGRLDILHLLLESGVSTLGYHRVQYVLSIIYAKQSGHQAVVQALYNHRSWSTKDQDIYQRLTKISPNDTNLFHPTEGASDEFLRVVAEISEVDSDRVSECSSDGSVSDEEERTRCMDENPSAGARTANATFRDESIMTTFYGNEDFGNYEQFPMSLQGEILTIMDLSNIYWPHQTIPGIPEGHENSTLGYHTLQGPFEGDRFLMEQSSMFQNVDETVDTVDRSLRPDSNALEWPGYNGMNISIDSRNEHLETAFPVWRQDGDEIMDMGGDMFEQSEWYDQLLCNSILQ